MVVDGPPAMQVGDERTGLYRAPTHDIIPFMSPVFAVTGVMSASNAAELMSWAAVGLKTRLRLVRRLAVTMNAMLKSGEPFNPIIGATA